MTRREPSSGAVTRMRRSVTLVAVVVGLAWPLLPGPVQAAGAARAQLAPLSVDSTSKAGFFRRDPGMEGPGTSGDDVATWVVPTITCGTENSVMFVRVGVSLGQSVVAAGMRIYCRHTKVHYDSFLWHFAERGPDGPAIAPGDTLKFDVGYTDKDKVFFLLEDVGHGSEELIYPRPPVRPPPWAKAEIAVLGRPDVALPDFGTISFTDCTFDGLPVSGGGDHRYQMVTADGTPRATTSPSTDQGDFTVTWNHS
jgi:hypothetical protein